MLFQDQANIQNYKIKIIISYGLLQFLNNIFKILFKQQSNNLNSLSDSLYIISNYIKNKNKKEYHYKIKQKVLKKRLFKIHKHFLNQCFKHYFI